MFNLDPINDKDGSADLSKQLSTNEDGKQVAKTATLDKPGMMHMHSRLLSYWSTEVQRQRDNRIEMIQDEEYYDNEQWSADDEQVLSARGQRALVYNVISSSVDWVTGTEKRSRTDYKILPRRKEGSKHAENKTALMKYLSDVNRTPFDTSRAFEDCVKVGVGWIEDGWDPDGDGEPLYTKYESWRNILWDSAGAELDLSDARYVFRSKWVDYDIAAAIFPERKHVLWNSTSESWHYGSQDMYGDEAMDDPEIERDINGRVGSDETEYRRQRVRVVEGWFKLPVQVKVMKGGDFNNEIYDPYSRGHRDALNNGAAELATRTKNRMYVGIFTTEGMLWFSESPYKHNQFPFTPIWGKRRGRDGLPYGMIRLLKDIQDDVNKRASKALHILTTNKVISDEGAVEDIDEAREELARPDAWIEKKPGTEITISNDRELAPMHMELFRQGVGMIQSASGVTDELLGKTTNASSGIAIERRQDQGSLATIHYFDHLRLAKQLSGEKQLSNIEQFMDEEKSFRITDQRGRPEFITVNDGVFENDIVATKADFVIDETDWNSTLRQAAVTELMAVIQKMPPHIGLTLLDLVVENMDVPNRDEIVKRIRAMNGQQDPDLDPDSEEAQQAAAAEEQRNQHAGQLAQLELAEREAKVEKSKAEANYKAAQTVDVRMKTQDTAIEGAGKVAQLTPQGVHTADHLLEESGYMSKTDEQKAIADQDAARHAAIEQQQSLPPPNPNIPQEG